MFRNIAEIISGKRARQTRLQGLLVSEPMIHFRESPDAAVPIADRFATALALTTAQLVDSIVLESKVPFLSDIATKLDSARLQDLAAFIAWWVVMTYQSDGAELVKDNADGLENHRIWKAVTSRIQEVMYPLRDRARQGVEAFNDAERRFMEGATMADAPLEGEPRSVWGQPRHTISSKHFVTGLT
jgi:hypothetical protein